MASSTISSSSSKLCLVLFFACALFVHSTIGTGEVRCEKLPPQLCSFAVSSTGKRCVLEGPGCKTSESESGRLSGHIETDQCVNACGVDRHSVGMSSSVLASPGFTTRLCSPDCFNSCPNIVDLYSNIAAGEGKSLPTMCGGMAMAPSSARRFATEGNAASAPTASPEFA